MKIDGLIPFNGETIQTKQLKELGYTANKINRLLEDKLLIKIKRGYYQVQINGNTDIKLMKYYLMNGYFDEFNEYFDSLVIKDYIAYYYRFMCDIMVNNYTDAYKHLGKCCELNKDKDKKLNLYAYILLLNDLMDLSNEKLVKLKNKIFDIDDSLNLFLEYIIKKDYDNACKMLKVSKETKKLSNLEVRVLRDLSIRAGHSYNLRNSPEMEEYNHLFNTFYECIMNNDYDSAQYYFNKLYNMGNEMNYKESRLEVIADLFNCFNYIVNNPDLDLDSYKIKYKYNKDTLNSFFMAIKRNDYINALHFINLLLSKQHNRDFEIYKNLLERIYNFLNIRSVIKDRSPQKNQLSLSALIKDKKYEEALEYTNKNDKMDTHDKNMITTLLESIVALDV